MSAATVRPMTYQTSDQHAVECAVVDARAALEGLKAARGEKPPEEAAEGLYRLGVYVAIAVRDDGARLVLPTEASPKFPAEHNTMIGVPLWQGERPGRPGTPYTMALITHHGMLALTAWRHRRLPIFDDGYMPEPDMLAPTSGQHRLILVGLLRMLEQLAKELREGEDWNWGPYEDFDDADDVDWDDETFHPSSMLAEVRAMITTAEQVMLAAEVMET